MWVGTVLHLDIGGSSWIIGPTSPPPIVDIGDSLGRAGLQLTYGGTGHGCSGRRRMMMHMIVRSTSRLLQRDVARGLWEVTLGFDEARLKVDDVVA